MFKAVAISLVVGALTVSTFEYVFSYNLIDLLKDRAVAVYHALRGK